MGLFQRLLGLLGGRRRQQTYASNQPPAKEITSKKDSLVDEVVGRLLSLVLRSSLASSALS
jgi:hypothetical protein